MTPMRPPVARPQKLAEHIAEQLRGQIIRRELADGDYLPVELDLCAHFGTSRPTMREAFRILEAEGLLQIRRGGRFGPRVQAPDSAVTAKSLGLLLQHQNVDLSAVYDTFLSDDRGKTFFHGHSFTANPLACAVAVASFDLFKENDVLARIARLEYHAGRGTAYDLVNLEADLAAARLRETETRVRIAHATTELRRLTTAVPGGKNR